MIQEIACLSLDHDPVHARYRLPNEHRAKRWRIGQNGCASAVWTLHLQPWFLREERQKK